MSANTSTEKNFKKVIVTGAAGFNGSHLVDYLTEKGYSVIATDLASANFKFANQRIEYLKKNSKKFAEKGITLEIVPADLTSPKTLDNLFKKRNILGVFHPAALFNMSANYDLLYKINVEGTENLCKAMLKHKVKTLINWSTAMVYNPFACKDEITEDCPLKPINNYALSKLHQEETAMDYNDLGLQVATIRPTAVYGPRSNYGLAKGIKALVEGKVKIFPTSGEHRTTYVHVDNVVSAVVFLFEHINKTKGQHYNIADDDANTQKFALTTLAEALNVSAPLFLKRAEFFIKIVGEVTPREFWPFIEREFGLEKNEIPYMLMSSIFSTKKLKNLGWKPKYPHTKDGLLLTLKWYVRNKFFPENWYKDNPHWEEKVKISEKLPKQIADYVYAKSA